MANSTGHHRQNESQEIKTMQLYSEVDRIYNDLEEMGYARADQLNVEDVSKFDHYHYYGTDAIDEAIAKLNITSESSVLDIGSGLGGTSRYLAHKTGCHVTAVELQSDLNDVARDLTIRCGLAPRVRHICANILDDQHLNLGQFDFVVSWLVYLHIDDKDKLFATCYKHLKPAGKMYIEDFFSLGQMSPDELSVLETAVSCHGLPSMTGYLTHLKNSGFSVEEWSDVTASWTHHCHERVGLHKANKEKYVRTHTLTSYAALDHFYNAVDKLFSGGNVGGCKIVATKV
ncbi:uncharacterized protein LOC141912012 isoform X2 [Tubulanus polymorphus]|uniref:uncharacterized protein LOC141912012 isoform X2 n=1 Tax=Tubulanus polymorphus TaxID=672921 RepID=UPI003DA2FAA8